MWDMPADDRTAMFKHTLRIARLERPRAAQRLLLRAAAADPRGVEQVLGLFAGEVALRSLLGVLLSGLAGGRSRRPRAACRR